MDIYENFNIHIQKASDPDTYTAFIKDDKGAVFAENTFKYHLDTYILSKLDEEEYHIIHYTGHGVYSEQDRKGYLLLEDDSGKSNPVDNDTFADLLAGYDSLRLVVLSGCQTSKNFG
ncbi:CHAT domain-containing protein [Candidatus Poribacteria bacterium]|nr:CHAT domain-containing protein [Candidatus Poribacteria bacterium]